MVSGRCCDEMDVPPFSGAVGPHNGQDVFHQGDCAISAAFVGLDPAKLVFQVHGVDGHGKVVMTKRLRRDAMLVFFANHLRPYVKRHKNDRADAIEAAQRPSMRFVAAKSEEQQSTLAIHRVRETLIA